MTPAALDASALRDHPLPPVVDGDKETKGRILVIAGSREVPGAALLTATAAMRAGAGKLRIATVESAAHAARDRHARGDGRWLPEADDGGFATAAAKRIGELAGEADAVVAGPGVQRNATCPRIVSTLLACGAALALDVAFLEALHEADEARAPIADPASQQPTSWRACSIAIRATSKPIRSAAAGARRSATSPWCWSKASPAMS